MFGPTISLRSYEPSDDRHKKPVAGSTYLKSRVICREDIYLLEYYGAKGLWAEIPLEAGGAVWYSWETEEAG